MSRIAPTSSMKTLVARPDPKSEFSTPEECFILESWNDPNDQDVSIARARVAPGVTTKLHRLRGTGERYVITHGSGLVKLENHPAERVSPGDVVVIPAGTAQQITNDGKGDLIFYCVCTPRFTPECWEALE